MRKFLIITLVLVAVLVMATAASASVRDQVASLVGAGSGDSSGDGGGTFSVTATKAGGEPDASEDAWAVKNAAESAGEGDTYTFHSSTEPAQAEPDGYADRDADRNGEEVEPAPETQVQPEEPVAEETATKKAKKGQEADPAE
jgi:hypothetical protein